MGPVTSERGRETRCIPEEELEEVSHNLDNSRIHQGECVLDVLQSARDIFMTYMYGASSMSCHS